MKKSEAALRCPECHSDDVRRSRRMNSNETIRTLIGLYPFRCNNCSERFWANVWLFSSWKWAKCPRCLNLNLTDWPQRHYRHSPWAEFLVSLGAQKHRCSRCRHNFVSFRSRQPARADGVPETAESEPKQQQPNSDQVAAEGAASERSGSERT